MTDVFVSYKAEDRRRVRPLVEALQADGFSVWWDEQIGGGATWRHAIEAELNAASCVVVVWSKRSVGPEGDFVQDEATRAKERHVYVPVIIDRVHLPLGFGETQALLLVSWHGNRSDKRYQAVLAAVRAHVTGNGYAIPKIVPSPKLDRRTIIAGGALTAVAVGGIGVWTLLRPGPAKASAKSIAVIPFANLSGDPAQTYFSDGIAEEIRSALTRLAGLKVVGRTSSEAVRNEDAKTAAIKLDVENILTGSVRQSSSTIRISAELIDGRTGLDKWSQDYDRSPGDGIRIQTDIAENVVRALSIALGSAARALTVGGTENSDAHRLLLQALEAARGRTDVGFQRALRLFDAAISLDSRYAEAYARKAVVLEDYADNFANTLEELRSYRSNALRSAQMAANLGPDFATAHMALGHCYAGVVRIGQAARELRRALDLAPGDSAVTADYAINLARLRQFSEAIRLVDIAVALDPFDQTTYRRRFVILHFNRKYAEALAFTEQIRKKSPELFIWPEYAGWASVFQGDLDRAERYFSLAPVNSYGRLVGESDLLIRRGRAPEVQSKIATLQRLYGDTVNYQLGQIYAQLGDKAHAFAALDRAWEIRDNGLSWTLVDPHLDPIRDDPRFKTLLEKINLTA